MRLPRGLALDMGKTDVTLHFVNLVSIATNGKQEFGTSD
jgi:hypothetical protein